MTYQTDSQVAAVLLSRPVFVSFTLAADFKFMRESFSENDHKWIDWPFGTVRGEMPASGYVASKFHLGADLPLDLTAYGMTPGVYRRWNWIATGKNIAVEKGAVVPFQYKEFFVTIKIAPDSTVLTWYTPTVEIRRNKTDEYPLMTLTCSTSCRTEEDAHNQGVELAMKWINDHPLGQ